MTELCGSNRSYAFFGAWLRLRTFLFSGKNGGDFLIRKALCVIITALLILYMLGVSVFADGTTIALSKANVTVGTNVTVTIRYNATYEMYAIDGTLTYNNAVLQYVSGGSVDTGSAVKIVEGLSGEKSVTYSIVFKIIAVGPGMLLFSAAASGKGNGRAAAGAAVTAIYSGDINNDGEVDNKDLTRLFQYLSEWKVETNEAALDVNGDSSVDNKDLTRLFQYLSNWEVEIY